MKLLVISDTHHYIDNARDVLTRIGTQIDAVIHLGDHDTDAAELKKEFSTLPFYVVKGNNDYGMETPSNRIIRMCGRSILLTHGHKQNVYFSYDSIAYWAEEKGADAVLFGHTHHPVYDNTGRVLLLNPGSLSLPRGGTPPTFAILNITEHGRMEAAIMAYDKNGAFTRMEPRMY